MSGPSANLDEVANFVVSDWIGRSIASEDEVELSLVRRMAAMTGVDPEGFRRGDALPQHWYSMFFVPNELQAKLGPDGHPQKGDFLPPVPLPRRMFVGREVQFMGNLGIGDRATKRSVIRDITSKKGASGDLVFVTVEHTISNASGPCVIEHQKIVYRPAATEAGGGGQAAKPMASGADWSVGAAVDPVLSFRYSALTWNSHRIHYDADYARDVEGYPACVVNGALTIHLVVDVALRHAAGRMARLNARLLQPFSVDEPMLLEGRSTSDTKIAAWAAKADGSLAATVEIEVVP
jgi:3-methylfumaryl-CoA hydratase